MAGEWKKKFIIIYIGQAFSLLGSSVVQFAIIWHITMRTESAVTLAVAAIASFLPNMLFGPFAGVWIDRYNRRTVMIAADGLVACSSVFFGALFLLSEAPDVWLIYLILFLRGIGTVFHVPAMQAAIPMLVPNEMLTKAGGWGSLANSLSGMLGPVLGAAFMSILPIAGIMLVDIVGAVFAIICLLFVKIPDITQTDRNRFLSDMKLGISAVWHNRPLLAVIPAVLLMNTIYVSLGSLLPLLIYAQFNGTAWHTGMAEFIIAVGLLFASVVIGMGGGMKSRFLMTAIAIVVMGVGTLISSGLQPSGFWCLMICCFITGASSIFISVSVISYAQETIAPEMMGKVFSLLMTAMTWTMPVGLLFAGPVSEFMGVKQWFFGSGVALIITGVVCRLMTRQYDYLTKKTDKMLIKEVSDLHLSNSNKTS